MVANETKQSQELAKRLWAIANDLRGNMNAAKFQNYILGVIFYRYLSEHTENYMDDLLKNDGISYQEALADPDYTETVKEWSLEHLGYIMEPKNLWGALIDSIKAGQFSIEDFEKAINALVGSTVGQDSEAAFYKLFDDMNLQDKDLGREVSGRTELISKVMLRVNDIPFGVTEAEIDVLGTAYMYLIALFADDAGKKGGEYFTPTCASTLVARLATVGLDEIASACDPCAGSASLLLEVKKHLGKQKVGHYYAQELNGSTYNLLRMNLLMHGVPYKEFTTYNDDTLRVDNFDKKKTEQFTVQVSNPPYSLKWAAPKAMEDDPRYSAAGVLAPKSYADLAFLEHMVYHMADDGRIAVLLPHGVLFRGGAEKKIREYLIGALNVVDAVIGLPSNLFHGTEIPVCILVLKKKRNGNSDNILFVNASSCFTPEKTKNILSDADIDRIVDTYVARENISRFATKVPLSVVTDDNDYNMNINRYVDTFDPEPVVDLDAVQSKLVLADEKGTKALTKVNAMLAELGLKGLRSDVVQKIFSQEIRFRADDGSEFPAPSIVPLSEVFDKITERNSQEAIKLVLTNSAELGIVPQRAFFDKDIAVEGNTQNYYIVRPGYFVYNPRKSKTSPHGPFQVYMGEEPGIISPLYTCLKKKTDDESTYLAYYFKSSAWYRYIYENASQGARHDRESMTEDVLMGIPVTLPSLPEQRKIAAFLTAMDDVIAAAKEQMEAMQEFKKGLLQQMFV